MYDAPKWGMKWHNWRWLCGCVWCVCQRACYMKTLSRRRYADRVDRWAPAEEVESGIRILHLILTLYPFTPEYWTPWIDFAANRFLSSKTIGAWTRIACVCNTRKLCINKAVQIAILHEIVQQPQQQHSKCNENSARICNKTSNELRIDSALTKNWQLWLKMAELNDRNFYFSACAFQ